MVQFTNQVFVATKASMLHFIFYVILYKSV